MVQLAENLQQQKELERQQQEEEVRARAEILHQQQQEEIRILEAQRIQQEIEILNEQENQRLQYIQQLQADSQVLSSQIQLFSQQNEQEEFSFELSRLLEENNKVEQQIQQEILVKVEESDRQKQLHEQKLELDREIINIQQSSQAIGSSNFVPKNSAYKPSITIARAEVAKLSIPQHLRKEGLFYASSENLNENTDRVRPEKLKFDSSLQALKVRKY